MEDQGPSVYGIGWKPRDDDNRADVFKLLERRQRQPPLVQGLLV